MSVPSYRFSTSLRVRWADCDAFGHLNNASYLSYFEEARLDYWNVVVPDMPFPGMALVHASVDFKAQGYPGDELTIAAAITEMKTTSFWVSYEVRRCDTVLGVGRTAQVFFDYASQKPMPIPDDFRARIAAYEGIAADGPDRAR